MVNSEADRRYMSLALELARRGEGHVEPNPIVGSVVVRDGHVVGEGWHERFGAPHAEVNALAQAGERARGGTLYVTLEPCCHTGKTPPCTHAILAAGVSRVVAAMEDPFPRVAGGGFRALQEAGVACDVGVLQAEARALVAPYLKLTETGRPWVIAKWAMTLDGKIATHSGSSQWISGEASRGIVHQLRGRVDAILVGAGTARADDPLLTARPSGPRTPLRIVLGEVDRASQLVATAGETPFLMVVDQRRAAGDYRWLTDAGGELLVIDAPDRETQITRLLDELGRRRVTNLLVEGGSQVLGHLFDAGEVDEVHAFIAPKIIGGTGAPSPVAGRGLEEMAEAIPLGNLRSEQVDNDVYLSGRMVRPRSATH